MMHRTGASEEQMLPLIRCNDHAQVITKRVDWRKIWFIYEWWLINAIGYEHEAKPVKVWVSHPVSECKRDTSMCLCGIQEASSLPCHAFLLANLLASTFLALSLKCCMKKSNVHSRGPRDLPSVSASPSSCLLCPEAFFPSTGQRSMMDWCRTLDNPYRRPCRRKTIRQSSNTITFWLELLVTKIYKMERIIDDGHVFDSGPCLTFSSSFSTNRVSVQNNSHCCFVIYCIPRWPKKCLQRGEKTVAMTVTETRGDLRQLQPVTTTESSSWQANDRAQVFRRTI